MNPGLVLALSACVNIALVGAAIHWGEKPRRPAPAAAAASSRGASEFEGAHRGSAPEETATVTFQTNRFTWERLESTNWTELAANLRAVGCPPETVREMIAGRARRELRQVRAGGMESGVAGGDDFWLAGRRRDQATRQREAAARRREQEVRERFQAATGAELMMKGSFDSMEEQALVRYIFGPVSEPAFQGLLATMKRQDPLKEEIKQSADFILLRADMARLEKLRESFRREFTSHLTPAELAELRGRLSALAFVDELKPHPSEFSPEEVRGLALELARASEPLDRLFDEHLLGRDEDVMALLRQVVPPEKLPLLERAADEHFQETAQFAEEAKLPRETAIQLHQLRGAMMRELKALREDTSLSAEERAERIRVFEQGASGQVQQWLGREHEATFLRGAGSWVTNLNSL